ncbi:MAG: hypothetical protein AB8B85_20490 [Paracoccaceae bacterium]
MRILLISIALVAGLVAGFATAGVPGDLAATQAKSNSVLAMRALISRCLPGIGANRAVVTTGMRRAQPADEAAILGPRDGRVWHDLDEKVLLIDFEDVPVCRVVALSLDPAVLADLVIRVFLEADGDFKRERFRVDTNGGFAAIYSGVAGRTPVLIRISTTHQSNGNVFASLNVEQAVPTSH